MPEQAEPISTDIYRIDVALLDPHPLNPRLCLDDRTVEGIATQLAALREYPREHAITVRAKGERFEIVRGHQRVAGAAMVGMRQVLAWVVEWDDEQTLIELGLSNRQGELTHLEVALHSLRVVEPAQGRTGMGIAEYAKRMGYDRGNLVRYRNGAEVYLAAVEELGASCIDTRSARRCAAHFAIIHGAPRAAWSTLVQQCLLEHWGVRATKLAVDREVQERAAEDGGGLDANAAPAPGGSADEDQATPSGDASADDSDAGGVTIGAAADGQAYGDADDSPADSTAGFAAEGPPRDFYYPAPGEGFAWIVRDGRPIGVRVGRNLPPEIDEGVSDGERRTRFDRLDDDSVPAADAGEASAHSDSAVDVSFEGHALLDDLIAH